MGRPYGQVDKGMSTVMVAPDPRVSNAKATVAQVKYICRLMPNLDHTSAGQLNRRRYSYKNERKRVELLGINPCRNRPLGCAPAWRLGPLAAWASLSPEVP